MSKKNNDTFADLIHSLTALPNVGIKSAQRVAYHLLQYNRKGAKKIADAINKSLECIVNCECCNTLCETNLCTLCADSSRDQRRLMIVHMPVDVVAMENARCHDGRYFVLMGSVNPLQNQDLSHINFDKLITQIQTNNIEEVIIATNFTAEGNATAYVLFEILKKYPLKISRLSHGIPLGGELEYIDAGTLVQAVSERKQLNISND